MNNIHPDTFSFLKELKKNNNKEWFHANKSRYSDIREGFIQFLESVYPHLCEFDPELKGIDPRKSVFRVNRDIRFSKDKSPYKSSIAGVIIAGGRKNFSEYSGYYLHIEPEHSLIAGGAYLPPSPWLKRIRKEIASDSESFREILEEKLFIRYFGVLSGEKLKGSPRCYEADHPAIDLLKYKSFTAVNEVSDMEVLSDSFGEHFINVSKTLKPFNDFLNYKE